MVEEPSRALYNARRPGRIALESVLTDVLMCAKDGGVMSLRTALAALPDDRGTGAVLREILAFFSAHPHTDVAVDRLVRATGLGHERIEPVLGALCSAAVLHCDGDHRLHDCSFDPDHVLALEIERFLRTAGAPNVRLQASVGRYRNRFGSA